MNIKVDILKAEIPHSTGPGGDYYCALCDKRVGWSFLGETPRSHTLKDCFDHMNDRIEALESWSGRGHG